MSSRLRVGLAELKSGLKVLHRAVTIRAGEEAYLSFDGEHLRIRLAGADVDLRAVGEWPGEACVSGLSVLAVAKVPPASDPVVMEASEDRLVIGTTSMPCRWQKAGMPTIVIPIDARPVDVLAIAKQHSAEDLEWSGLADAVQEAKAQRSKMIEQAARILFQLGVSTTEIEAMVEKAIARRRDRGDTFSLEP